MRGKDGEMLQVWKLTWITPAYAGKRHSFSGSYAVPRDHPRLCGEKCCWTCFERQPTGSPPPMRGKVPLVTSIAIVIGITPAYAGKRICAGLASGAGRDHPRLCGEKVLKFDL